jgi:peroxiredoxin/uncharacterized membrane protein YphA (DoxX/SURF4 family)
MVAVEISARLLLGALLVTAGAAKLWDLEGARTAVRDFGIPTRLSPAVAIAIPLLEIGLGLLLPWTATSRPAAIAAAAMLGAFSVTMALNLGAGRQPDCHCFGRMHSRPITWKTLGFTSALTGVAAWLGWSEPVPLRLERLTGLFSASELILLGVLVAVCVAAAWIVSLLMHQQGRMLIRLDSLEARLGMPAATERPSLAAAGGLSLGASAPGFQLPSLTGAVTSLDSLLAGGRPLLLIFIDPQCGPCSSLLPEVAQWRIAVPSVNFVLVSRGSPEEHRGHHLPPGSLLLFQRDREVATAYRCHGTPGAVLVQPHGAIGSATAMGADAIRALVAPWLGATRTRAPHAPLAIGSPAPDIALPDQHGRTRSLRDFRGREVVLLFWNPSCGYCVAMLPRLRAWWRDHRRSRDLLFVTVAPFDCPGELDATILLAPDFATAGSFGAGGTPSAVLVTTGGLIGSSVLAGETAILKELEVDRGNLPMIALEEPDRKPAAA